MTAESCDVLHCRNERSWVITTLSCLIPLAGFEVSLIGRFSGVPRGERLALDMDIYRLYRLFLEYAKSYHHQTIRGGKRVWIIAGRGDEPFHSFLGREEIINALAERGVLIHDPGKLTQLTTFRSNPKQEHYVFDAEKWREQE